MTSRGPDHSTGWYSRAVALAPRNVRVTLERLCATHGARKVGAAVSAVALAPGAAAFQGALNEDDSRTITALERIDAAIMLALVGDRASRRPGVYLHPNIRRQLAETLERVRAYGRELSTFQAMRRRSEGPRRRPRLETLGDFEEGIPPANNRSELDAIFRGLGAGQREAARLVSFLLTLLPPVGRQGTRGED